MKYLSTSIACTFFVAGVTVGIHWPKTPYQVGAQEIRKDSSFNPHHKGGKNAFRLGKGAFGTFGDRPYPTFCVDEVIAKLTTATTVLIEKKLTKNADELRKNLDRTSFSLKLSPESTKVLTTQELYRQTMECVFLVAGLTRPTEADAEWKTSFSTAFVVHEDGILSTSAHVFDHDDHDDAVVALDFQGNVYPVLEVLAANRKADTLLFRIGAKGLKPMSLGQEAAPGSPVRVLGHPGDSFYFFSIGHLANYERDEEDNSWLNITADFGQGSSGGPVMDEAGNVIGQVSRTYTLYAGGETSNRRRRRTTRQLNAEGLPIVDKDAPDKVETESEKKTDPQMVFKACTPVSAIRALVK